MRHLSTLRLETDRLILRRYTPDDAEAMFRNWASDSEVTRFLTWPAHSSAEVSLKVLESWIARYAEDDYYHWAIVLKEHGDEPIGDIAAVKLNEDTRCAEIGYCLGRNWWHRGIMSEALGAVTDFLFGCVGMNRVEARHDTRNPNSGRVMLKCGMRYEGTLRASDRNNQGICDICQYAILRQDWEAMKSASPASQKERPEARIEIVRINETSAARVVPLIAGFRAELRAFRGIVSEPDTEQAREEIAEFLEKGYPVYAAIEGGETVGYIVCRIDAPCLWVEHIFVREDHRRRGTASLLFGKAEELAREMGDDTVYNFVHPNNEGMIAFLRSKGYTVLNMLEIRRPWTGEKLASKVRVDGNTFDY